MDHLLKTESGIFDEMRQGVLGARQSPLADRIRSSLLNALMSTPARLKVPAAATMVLPEGVSSLPQLEDAWDACRSRMRNWTGDLSPNAAALGVFRHPVSGWMTLSQTFGFFSAHIRHHAYQLKRISRASGWATLGAHRPGTPARTR